MESPGAREPSRGTRSKHLALATSTVFALVLAAPTVFAETRCPTEMALIDAGTVRACVDKYEASLVDVDEAGHTTPHSPYEPPNGRDVRAVSQPGVVPQAHVSMLEAKRACESAGKRLCRADEWIAACKGPSGTRYPYGDEHVDDVCVDTARTPPLSRLHPGPDMYTSRSMNDPRLNQQPNTVEKTGEAAQCTNAFGVHDMVGNLHEWADDGAFHGGYYLDTKQNGEGCDYVTTAHAADYYDYSTGFRCCADPEEVQPATVTPVVTIRDERADSFFAWIARFAEELGAPFVRNKNVANR